jgi:hypothetical protein
LYFDEGYIVIILYFVYINTMSKFIEGISQIAVKRNYSCINISDQPIPEGAKDRKLGLGEDGIGFYTSGLKRMVAIHNAEVTIGGRVFRDDTQGDPTNNNGLTRTRLESDPNYLIIPPDKTVIINDPKESFIVRRPQPVMTNE